MACFLTLVAKVPLLLHACVRPELSWRLRPSDQRRPDERRRGADRGAPGATLPPSGGVTPWRSLIRADWREPQEQLPDKLCVYQPGSRGPPAGTKNKGDHVGLALLLEVVKLAGFEQYLYF